MKIAEALGGKRFRLQYRHHRKALLECEGSGKEAIKWLKLAEENSWTPAEMRAANRRALSDNGKGVRGARGSVTITTDLRRFQDRLKKILDEQPVKTWTATELEAFTEDSAAICDLLTAAGI